jgi:hypothetical protein
MTLEGLLVGALAILVGLAFAFVGYRFFLVLLPIWGFVVGFALTANAIAGLLNEGFLVTILGWIAGFFVGLVFAVLSYFFWYVAVIVLAGTVGYALGASILAALGIDSGFLIFLAGLAVGVVFFIGAIVLAVPKWAIVVLTAIGGAGAIVVGAALAIGRFPVSGLSEGGIVGAAIGDSVLWALAWAALAVAGVVVQLRSSAAFTLDRSGYRDVTVVSARTR